MLVDDSSAVREPWTAALNTEQLKVMESPDGESALAHRHHVEHGACAAVLHDRPPGMDGLSLAHKMRAHPNWSDEPILMCSTTTDPATSRKARVLGINAWAVKPFQPKQLVRTVRSLIGQDGDEST